MKHTLLVTHKETGEQRLIVAERFNPELHEIIDAPVVLTPEETIEEVKEDLTGKGIKELREIAEVRGINTDGLKKKDILNLLTK